jgi:TP901 family phage tail tape measure protein
MAEEQIVTNIVAKSDFSNLIADLNKVSSALTNLQAKLNATNKNLSSQVNVMNRSFAETMRSTGQFSTHFVNLTSDVDKFGSQLDKGQIKLKQFAQIYQTHIKTSGGLVRQLAQQQVQLQNAILQPLGKNAEGLMQYNVHIPAGLDKVKNKSALARQELQIMNKVVQEGANSLINWGKNTQWAGRQLTVGLTLPLAAFGKASADAFRAADQELTRLTKVYGGLAATSAKELGKVREDVTKTATELSKAYGASFKETIALGADIAATGKQGNELLGSIRETTRLAVLGEVDRQDAMKATLAIQSAFKSNTEELAESINFLNAVENQTSTTLNDLVEAIPKAGPIIKGLGGDVQDLALYLTAMREGGVSASEGANALKSGLASLINPTKVAKDMFAGFGISLTDIVQKNAGNTTETLLALQSALDRLDPLQKQQALEQLFGKFQFARMNALFENLGRQGSQTLQVLDLMKASSQDLANIAGRELSMVTESASGKYRRALEGLKADLAGVGEQFLTINTYIINAVDAVLKFVNKLPGPVKTVLGLFGGLTALAGPMIMLTGVLGNFFGYIIKGVSHMRALTKGGEGWKLLTPEILAANKAGGLVEQTFYSDAKASDILNQAIQRLSASYTRLAADASNAMIATNPVVSTLQGTPITLDRTPRKANVGHSLIGGIDERAAAHGNPVGLMNQAQRSLQTIHSVTPNPIPVNQAIGKNPQIFSYQDMPNVPGLTTIKGVSTGIVAGEAAKWHSLMATLSMQTKQEVAQLKKEIYTTGTISQEFLSSYSTILPAMTGVIDNAVMKSAQIVQQAQMGQLRIDQAQAKIIAINAQLEADMAATTAMMAQQMGRTANLTTVPLTGESVVDKAGKSNLRALFREGRASKKMMDAIARATGVKTYGGGYSIETTIPKKFATGGTVPGVGNTDSVPAMLTPGEFVVNAEATRKNLPLLRAMNNNRGSNGPNYELGSSSEVRSRYKGRELAHLTETTYFSDLSPAQQRIASIGFGLSPEQQSNPNTRINSSLFAAFHSFFNQGTNSGNLSLKTAIDYLSGKTVSVKDRSGKRVRVKHDPLIAYEALMADLGIAEQDRASFVQDIDDAFINKLKKEQENGRIFLSDKSGENKVKSSVLGDELDSLISKKYPTLKSKFNILKAPGEARVIRPGKGSRNQQRIFPKATTKASTLIASIVAKKKMPAVTKEVAAMFPKIKTNIYTPPQKMSNGRYFHNYTRIAGLGAGAALLGSVLNSSSNNNSVLGFNKGGLVPGYQDGGQVPVTNTPRILFPDAGSYSLGSMEQTQQSMGMRRGAGIAGMIGGSLAFTGGATLGQKVGGGFGSIAGGMLASVAADSLIRKLMSVNSQGKATASIFGKLGPLMANPYVMAGAAIVGVTAGLLKLKKNSEEAAKINRLAFSGGVKPIQDFDSKIKEVQKSIENTKAVSELLHAQLTTAGISGVVTTIKEFEKLKETLKSTSPELVKLFKQTPDNKLVDIATGLKAQFVAAGDAAYKANEKIAALMQLGGKGGMLQAVLGSEGIKGITDVNSAITSMLNTLSYQKNNKDFVGGLLQSFTSMDSVIEKSTTKSYTFKQQLDLINKSGSANVKISQEQINELGKQYPELAKILDVSDSIGDSYSKWRIYLAGITQDISNLNSKQLAELAEYATKIGEYFNKIGNVSSKEAQSNSITGKMAKDIDAFNKKQNAAQKSIVANIEQQISLKEKQIAQIKKEADARKKALQDQQQIEDVKLQIQQEQLNYQNALAAGDMSSAAQAQINIQRLVGQQQLKAAENAIDDAAQKKIDALQAQIDVLNRKASVQSQTTPVAKKSPYEDAYNQINQLFKDVALAGGTPTEEHLRRFNDLSKSLGMTAQGREYLKTINPTGVTSSYITREDRGNTVTNLSGTTAGNALQSALMKNVETNVVAAGISKSNEYLKGILEALKPGSTGSGKLDIKNGSIETSTLVTNKVDTKVGTVFTASDGKKYKIVRNNQYWGTTDVVPFTRDESRASKATGGFIRGAGTGTSDSIPAMLSNGEYVIRAAAVQAIGTPTLDRINRMAAGGLATKYDIPRMSMGGRVNYNMGGSVGSKSSNSLYNINVTLNGSNLDANDVARAIHNEMRMREITMGRNRVI